MAKIEFLPSQVTRPSRKRHSRSGCHRLYNQRVGAGSKPYSVFTKYRVLRTPYSLGVNPEVVHYQALPLGRLQRIEGLLIAPYSIVFREEPYLIAPTRQESRDFRGNMPTELYVLLHQLRSTHIHDYHSVEPAYYYGVHPTQCPEEGIVGSIPILSLYGTMTFYDLNVPYTSSDANVVHTLHFLAELGYTTVALSQSLSTKFPPNQTPPVMPTNIPKSMTLLTRLNLTVSEPSQNPRLTTLAQSYSLLAIRPTNEKSLMQACNNLDCDIISLDLAVRLPFHFKFKTLSSAVARGVRFEICYSPGLTGSGPEARRNLISNAISLVRATRGRGIILSSEAKQALGVRAPFDVINLACLWGMTREKCERCVVR
ncbi:ribonuclease P/MRP subunit [Coccidioides immitis RMSCC 3703]|uniref:Ribonuclease P/MRP subunit n=1 Tax=Coccidioides immitis RMSCC 3703 TaxID=454286 RepID=A0A0J8QSW0_COCIT|nr:ribonuclease P/MRP subunit [Coccidioides immitis RMSCC 3703]